MTAAVGDLLAYVAHANVRKPYLNKYSSSFSSCYVQKWKSIGGGGTVVEEPLVDELVAALKLAV